MKKAIFFAFSEKDKRPLSNDYTILSDVLLFEFCLTPKLSEYWLHSQPLQFNILIHILHPMKHPSYKSNYGSLVFFLCNNIKHTHTC